MDDFISLSDAARIIAGEDAKRDTLNTWCSLLEAQADQLQAVKSWTTHEDRLPGGVRDYRPSEEWRIPRQVFNRWREANGYTPKDKNAEVAESARPDSTVWTASRRREARAMLKKLKSDGVRDFAARTATHFGCSTARLREVLSAKGKVLSPNDGGNKSKKKIGAMSPARLVRGKDNV